jgi:hypothetical protein
VHDDADAEAAGDRDAPNPPGAVQQRFGERSAVDVDATRILVLSVTLPITSDCDVIEICIKNAIIGTEACTYAQTEG